MQAQATAAGLPALGLQQHLQELLAHHAAFGSSIWFLLEVGTVPGHELREIDLAVAVAIHLLPTKFKPHFLDIALRQAEHAQEQALKRLPADLGALVQSVPVEVLVDILELRERPVVALGDLAQDPNLWLQTHRLRVERRDLARLRTPPVPPPHADLRPLWRAEEAQGSAQGDARGRAVVVQDQQAPPSRLRRLELVHTE
mmetsp:Transcript_50088/g.157781  ORF Transcript_50088/g.157781 Transcript_50088/m.157781 type:complete len:200 (+) Transcript_50088:450-1049(+)